MNDIEFGYFIKSTFSCKIPEFSVKSMILVLLQLDACDFNGNETLV